MSTLYLIFLSSVVKSEGSVQTCPWKDRQTVATSTLLRDHWGGSWGSGCINECPNFISVAVTSIQIKSILIEKDVIHLTIQVTVNDCGELKVHHIKSKTKVSAYMCSAPLCSYKTAREWCHPQGAGLPTSLHNQDNSPQSCPQANPIYTAPIKTFPK